MALLETDRKVAEDLAQEVRTASGGPRTWRRVASLLEAFGVERLSDEVRERIAEALAEARIAVDPPLTAVDRDQMVLLALPDSDAVWALIAKGAEDHRPRPVIAATGWGPGGTVRELSLDEPAPDGVTAWFDVDPARTTPQEILETLWPVCSGGLTEQMVEDLVDSARRPGVRSYGDDLSVRLVSAFGMEGRERNGDPGGAGSKAGELIFRPVKLLAGNDWLVTTWPEDPQGAAYAEAVRTVRRRLELHPETPTPGDIGIGIVYSLTCTYPATERRLHSWLDAWETDFNRHLDADDGSAIAQLEKATLLDLRRLLADLRRWLHGFEQPGIDPSEAWFRNVTDVEMAQRVGGLVNSTLGELAALDDALRTSLDLLVTSNSAAQLTAANAQAARVERLDRRLALITSVLLVPTFLAELSGTKVLPLGENWWYLAGLFLAMAVLGLTTFRIMTRHGSQ